MFWHFSVACLLWICFNPLCWTLWGLSIWKFTFCSWEISSWILLFLPMFPLFLNFLIFSFISELLSSNPYSIRFPQFIFILLLHFYFCWVLNFVWYFTLFSSIFFFYFAPSVLLSLCYMCAFVLSSLLSVSASSVSSNLVSSVCLCIHVKDFLKCLVILSYLLII